jgi:hypothetical protein
VKRLIQSKPTMEGAGVHLRRAFGFGNTTEFDPFLLLDDFRNDVPDDYLAGFPWQVSVAVPRFPRAACLMTSTYPWARARSAPLRVTPRF